MLGRLLMLLLWSQFVFGQIDTTSLTRCDINTDEIWQLEELDLLDYHKIEAIIIYIKAHGELVSLSELGRISELDHADFEVLKRYAFVRNKNQRSVDLVGRSVFLNGSHYQLFRTILEEESTHVDFQLIRESGGNDTWSGIIGQQVKNSSFYFGKMKMSGFRYYNNMARLTHSRTRRPFVKDAKLLPSFGFHHSHQSWAGTLQFGSQSNIRFKPYFGGQALIKLKDSQAELLTEYQSNWKSKLTYHGRFKNWYYRVQLSYLNDQITRTNQTIRVVNRQKQVLSVQQVLSNFGTLQRNETVRWIFGAKRNRQQVALNIKTSEFGPLTQWTYYSPMWNKSTKFRLSITPRFKELNFQGQHQLFLTENVKYQLRVSCIGQSIESFSFSHFHRVEYSAQKFKCAWFVAQQIGNGRQFIPIPRLTMEYGRAYLPKDSFLGGFLLTYQWRGWEMGFRYLKKPNEIDNHQSFTFQLHYSL